MSKQKRTTLTIEFDREELMSEFRGWLRDGGGEYDFMESCVIRKTFKGVSFDYEGDLVTVTADDPE